MAVVPADSRARIELVEPKPTAQLPSVLRRSVASRARESGGKSIANYDVLIFRPGMGTHAPC